MPDAQTIEEVIARLDAIIDGALAGAQRIGYFAALYERVTTNVRRALVAGNVFEDGARMRRLDVIFANRFLAAWEAHAAGAQPPAAWRVAFDLLDDPQPLVVQHLLAGMNAHINLDLGVAAATVAPTRAELESLRRDFVTINNILARLLAVVETELGQISARFGRVERLAPRRLEDSLFGFGMKAAREYAWLLAQELVAAGAPRRSEIIALRDAETAAAGKLLHPLRGLAGAVARWARADESSDIRLNIQIVAE